MAGYRLHLTYADIETIEALADLDDLAERVALEQLTHELNPATPTGYVVTFRVVTSDHRTAADGRFYVRAPTCVAPPVEIGNALS